MPGNLKIIKSILKKNYEAGENSVLKKVLVAEDKLIEIELINK